MILIPSSNSSIFRITRPFQFVGLQSSLNLRQIQGISEPSTTTINDKIVQQMLTSTNVSDYQMLAASFGGVADRIITWSSSNTEVAQINSYGFVTWQANGESIITASSGSYSISKLLSLYTNQSVSSSSFISYEATSAAYNISNAVDSRLIGKSPTASLRIFTTQNHSNGIYVRNTESWCYGLDLTAISPWNSSAGQLFAGTLISPRHIIFAAHYQIPVGATIRFIDQDNTVVERVMTAKRVHPNYTPYYPDIAIGVLSADVPAGISFSKILPSNWQSYLPSLSGIYTLPALCLDQEEKALVTDFTTTANGSAYFGVPTKPDRLCFYESKIGGDSGNPAFLIINNELVILTVWTYSGAGSGTFLTTHKDAINTMMTQLGGGYQLTEVDLSSFPSY